MRQIYSIWTMLPVTCALGIASPVSAQDLSSFAVLAGSTITNTGPTVITGNIGVSPGSAITGFPPGIVLPPYAIYQNEAVSARAQSDLTTAYNLLAGRPATADLTGQDLGGQTLTAGVYNYSTSAQLTGTLTLDAQGDPNAVFIIKIGSTLTTASASSVQLINGAQGANVYFQVGSSATLGTETDFAGKIFALTSITLGNGADIDCGAALARNGAVTLDTNTISICTLAAATYASQLGSSSSANERAVSAAIDRFVAGGGTLPLTFQVLPATLSPKELAAAMTQLSGQAATGVAPGAMEAMDSFLSILSDKAFEDVRDAPVQEGRPDPVQRNTTISVLGYAPYQQSSQSPFGNIRSSEVKQPAPRLWSVWAAAYAGHTSTDGNSYAGSHNRSSRGAGIAAGVDYRVSADTKIGFALGGGSTRFSLANGLGSGASDMFQAAVYGRSNFGAAYVTAVAAYAWHDVNTHRVVTLGGNDVLGAQFNAHNAAGQLEAGYRFGWLTPYAAVGVQAFTTPYYAEQARNGVSLFALSYDGQTTIATRSQLGFRAEHTFVMSEDVALRLRVRVAWAHDFSDAPYVDASFQALPGSTFRVKGAARPADSLLLSTGAELKMGNGLSLAGLLDSQLASGSTSYAGRAQLRYTW